MPLIYKGWASRGDLRANPRWLFVFADNLDCTGLGGQATAMRGEPNAVGIPTKKAPHMGDAAFFTGCDEDIERFLKGVQAPFERLVSHLHNGGTIVWPAEGLRAALADLQERAPSIADAISTIEAILLEVASAAEAA